MKSPKDTSSDVTLAARRHHIKKANETNDRLLKLTEISRVLAPPVPFPKKWYVFCILPSFTDLVSGLHSNPDTVMFYFRFLGSNGNCKTVRC